MFQLLLTIMSIVLIAATAMATLTYTDTSMVLQKRIETQVTSGFSALERGWLRYSEANRTVEWVCSVHTTELDTYEDCRREETNPGHLAPASWESNLIPGYTFKPRAPEGMNWSYNESAQGWYFCLQGTINEVVYKGIKRAQRQVPIDSMVISDSCGEVSSLTDAQINFAQPVSVTYWVKKDSI